MWVGLKDINDFIMNSVWSYNSIKYIYQKVFDIM